MRRLEVSPADKYGLDRLEAAVHIGVSPTLFDEMVKDGRMPAPKLINTRRVWKRAAIEKAFDQLGEDAKNAPPAESSKWSLSNCSA